MVITPRKSLGQNFLKDPNTINSILKHLSLDSESWIIELGCGLGALTEEILKRTKNFIGIEKDKRLFDYLSKKLANEGITLLNADMLEVSFCELTKRLGGKTILVGNLPYNISTQIIFKLIEEFLMGWRCEYAILMFQKEVADRLSARPGSKEYGVTTVLLRYVCEIESLLTVPPHCFYPAPKVYSSVLKLTFRDYPLKAHDFNQLKGIVKRAFSMRRKNIFNSLKGIVSDEVLRNTLTSLGLDKNLRAEDLTLDTYIMISNRLTQSQEDNKRP